MKRQSVRLLVFLLVFLASLWIDGRVWVLEDGGRPLAVMRDTWATASASWPDRSFISQASGREHIIIDSAYPLCGEKGMNIELILWCYGVGGGEGLWGSTVREDFWVDAVVSRYRERSNLFMYTVANEFERYPSGKYSY
jgi:hypothetical protein